MSVQTKICGIKTPVALRTACDAGVRYLGFVFYPPSPRHVEIDTARELALMVPTGIRAVGLFVDPDDAQLEAVLGKVQLDMIQLHGDETVERCRNIKDRFNVPLIKAFRVGSADDLLLIERYRDVSDMYLFDARPADATLPGGTGHAFDWSLMEGMTLSKPWMLSGGLDANNVSEALSILLPDAVDVSSGVEVERGVKDEAKIKAFLEAVKGL